MTAEEAAMIMMSGGGGKVIQRLSVTQNGKYEAPEGVDGYNPVLVNVPDRYDEGYQDGSNDTRSEIENNSDDPTHIIIVEKTRTDIETNPDDPTHKKLYDEGFAFADEFFNGKTDPDKTYTLVVALRHIYENSSDPRLTGRFYLCYADSVPDDLRYLYNGGYVNSEQRWVDGTQTHSYGTKISNVEWGSGYGNLYVTLTGSDINGNIYTDLYKINLAVTHSLSASNTNIINGGILLPP
ncbi:MAG: hypothetical protein ACI4GX_04955 [Ruminococcus sp.]